MGLYIAPISMFCHIFNHLDWKGFTDIAEKRAAEKSDNVQDDILENIQSNDNRTDS